MYDKMKFIITGSSHTLLQAGIYESLVGRINTRVLLPLKFVEYLEFMGGWTEERITIFGRKTAWPGRDALKRSLAESDPSHFESYVNAICAREMGEKPFFKKNLNDYLLKGGYPHSIKAGTVLEAGQILRQDLELTVYKDIHSLFNTREPRKLMEILTLIARNTGGSTSQNSMAKDTSFDWKSVVASIGYFEQLFMVKEVHPIESLHERTTKSSMLYFTDPGIFNVLLGQMDEQTIREDKRRLLLTALASHITRLKMNLTDFQDSSLYFFEGTDSIEFIIDKPKMLPVAICLDGEDRQRKLEAMKGFMGTHNSKLGILLTEDNWGREGDIILMPAWLFLVLC
jgi:predicted AAA+ superfamily ATPase